MKNLMIDLETMGTDSYSAILSIGAVGFDMETGKTGPEFYCNVDLDSCIKKGLRLNGRTVMWWMAQSNEARESLTNPAPKKLEDALSSFSLWVRSNFSEESVQVWGNSARFDLGILQNAYEKVNMDAPWKFNNERCVRTLASFSPETKRNYVHDGVDHNALSDCYKQIGYCSAIWKNLNSKIENEVHG